HDTSTFYGNRQLTLVLCTCTCNTTWQDLTTFRNKSSQQICIFIVNIFDMISCDKINFTTATSASTLLWHVGFPPLITRMVNHHQKYLSAGRYLQTDHECHQN